MERYQLWKTFGEINVDLSGRLGLVHSGIQLRFPWESTSVTNWTVVYISRFISSVLI